MSAESQQAEKDVNCAHNDSVSGANNSTPEPLVSADDVAKAAARFGYGPLAKVDLTEASLEAFGGEAQPGRYRPVQGRKFANPAPLGLCGFALTTFILSAINMGTRDITEPSIVIGCAFGYGGLVQLLAGMWEMAVGNTFGATALSSYGGFWISFAIILTPGGFTIVKTLESAGEFYDSMGLYLMAWFIFTTIMLLLTLKSTFAFCSIFVFLDIAYLLLGIGYLQRKDDLPNKPVLVAGGFFGLLSAFAAWYNAFAGIADTSNSFFIAPVIHFPWSDTGRNRRRREKRDRDVA